MSDTPMFDETRAATHLDVDTAPAPALAALGPARIEPWLYIPPHLKGPCEDRPPHQLTDHDGVE